MTGMPTEPYYYNIQVEGGPNPPLLYIVQDGKLVTSLFGLVFENGVWTESIAGPPVYTTFSQEPFGAGGTRLHFDGNIEGPQAGYELDLYLAFEIPVDFAQPLPLDRLALDQSLLSLTIMFQTTSSPVVSVTRSVMPPSPLSAEALRAKFAAAAGSAGNTGKQ